MLCSPNFSYFPRVAPPSLPPLPASDVSELTCETFAAPGLEAVEVIRPKNEVYCRAGSCEDAPALVLVPGLGMDCRGYIRQLPLGAVADLHFLQASNEAVEGEEGFGHFARGVEQYILEKGLDKRPGGFILGGCSMGGAVSIHVCARGKVKPRALLIMGSFANCMHLPYYQRLLAPLSWYLPINLGKTIVRRLVGLSRTLKTGRFDDAHFMVSCGVNRSQSYYGRAIMALTRQNQLREAATIDIPTLVMHGTGDWVLPHAAGEEMAQTIPNAKFVSVKGGGHGFFFTHAEEVNEAVAAFISAECAPSKVSTLKRNL